MLSRLVQPRNLALHKACRVLAEAEPGGPKSGLLWGHFHCLPGPAPKASTDSTKEKPNMAGSGDRLSPQDKVWTQNLADSWPMACFLLLLFGAHPVLGTQQVSQSTCRTKSTVKLLVLTPGPCHEASYKTSPNRLSAHTSHSHVHGLFPVLGLDLPRTEPLGCDFPGCTSPWRSCRAGSMPRLPQAWNTPSVSSRNLPSGSRPA